MLADLEKRVCRECSGYGTVCWCCMSAITDCECAADQEPGPCDVCEGSGMETLSHTDKEGA